MTYNEHWHGLRVRMHRPRAAPLTVAGPTAPRVSVSANAAPDVAATALLTRIPLSEEYQLLIEGEPNRTSGSRPGQETVGQPLAVAGSLMVAGPASASRARTWSASGAASSE